MEDIAFAVCTQGNLFLLRRLLDTTPSILEAREPATGRTLLHVAACQGHEDVCVELVARDPKCILALDNAGHRASHDASPTITSLLASIEPEPLSPAGTDDNEAMGSNPGPEQPVDLCSLPSDMCEMVLSKLVHHGITPLLRLSETCRRMRQVSSSESVWETLCWQDFKLQRRSVVSGSWREMYVEHRVLHGSVKDAGLRGRKQRQADRTERAGLRSTVSQGEVEGTIWGIGHVRVSVEGTIWDTSTATSADGLQR